MSFLQIKRPTQLVALLHEDPNFPIQKRRDIFVILQPRSLRLPRVFGTSLQSTAPCKVVQKYSLFNCPARRGCWSIRWQDFRALETDLIRSNDLSGISTCAQGRIPFRKSMHLLSSPDNSHVNGKLDVKPAASRFLTALRYSLSLCHYQRRVANDHS